MHWNRICRSIAPGSSLVERPDQPCSYLIEAGVLAASVTLDRTPLTCVDLLGAGTLIGLQSVPAPCASSYRAVSSVRLLEIPPGLFRQSMQRRPQLQEAYLRQLRQRVTQIEMMAVCNAHHPLSERCARWLLRLHAQLGPVIPVTHAFLATMVGVRRAGISVTLENLQREGLVRQWRGSIEVLDAAALQSHACPCADVVASRASAISAELFDDDLVNQARPRAWVAKETKIQSPEAVSGDEGWARREAALRLCRSIVTQGLAVLEQ